jgi:hypothetical protein
MAADDLIGINSIIYDPATTPLGIVRVLRGAQDIPAILEREE